MRKRKILASPAYGSDEQIIRMSRNLQSSGPAAGLYEMRSTVIYFAARIAAG